jgi:hypothetical protein
MPTRAELKRQYRETLPEAGIFLVTNTAEGKVLLGSSLNLHGPLEKHRFLLENHSHRNRRLQEDWDRLGPDAFRFEIAEKVKRTDDPGFRIEDELELLEQIWLEKLAPYYNAFNEVRRIRDP